MHGNVMEFLHLCSLIKACVMGLLTHWLNWHKARARTETLPKPLENRSLESSNRDAVCLVALILLQPRKVNKFTQSQIHQKPTRSQQANKHVHQEAYIADVVGIPLIYLVHWNGFKLQLPKDTEVSEYKDFLFLLCFSPRTSWKQTEAGSRGIVSSQPSRSPGLRTV